MAQHGILPDLAADTHAHLLALPHRPHTVDTATFTGGLLVGEVVEWAKGSDPSHTLIHVAMREPVCVTVLSARRGAPWTCGTSCS